MTFDRFYKFSDWNPQVFRELKGRVKKLTVFLTVLGSCATQLLVLMYFWVGLPVARSTDRFDTTSRYSTYCTGRGSYRSFECIYDAIGNPRIAWQSWWSDLFQALSWTLPFVLLLAGVYMLVSDLGKEERRGTLNFIRLSPQTSQNILFGKVLGVPVIPYLAVLLAIPLHLVVANGAGVSIANVLSIYLLTAAACAFFYSGALLYAFMSGAQGWVGAVAVFSSYTLFFQIWTNSSYYRGEGDRRYLEMSDWFHLPVGTQLGFAITFALITLGTGAYWLWQSANRRFRNPDVTLLSKRQSYWMTFCVEVWMLGFAFRQLPEYYRPFNELIVLGFFNLLWFMVLIAALTPQRQLLLDWARYRRERVASKRQFWSRSIVKDLLWGEKSPALAAIALNLLIAVAVASLWIVGWAEANSQFDALVVMSLGATLTLICAAIAQLMMFMKSPKRALWAAGAVAAVLILPPVVLGALQITTDKTPFVWLFSIGAFSALQSGVSATAALTALMGQLGILSLLTLRLTRQVRRAGESEMKALLAASRS
ncbi:MAG: hypothetical protein KME42_13095 [Tildeniella nuda ZEHNDER 1965/U140]|jgi:hypothetical protein|nr:hypothetical protein [Tildeniella nuda ZEHNDER 1965/U140]